MKIEIVCDRPGELTMLENAFGEENMEVVIPKKWDRNEYIDTIYYDNDDMEKIKRFKVLVDFKTFISCFKVDFTVE